MSQQQYTKTEMEQIILKQQFEALETFIRGEFAEIKKMITAQSAEVSTIRENGVQQSIRISNNTEKIKDLEGDISKLKARCEETTDKVQSFEAVIGFTKWAIGGGLAAIAALIVWLIQVTL